jgi:hypothetical protein
MMSAGLLRARIKLCDPNGLNLMPIKISDNERGVMAAMIREKVHKLQATTFNIDPLVPDSASIATSRISSAFKHHGHLLQAALFTAIGTCGDYQTWNEVPLTDPSNNEGFQIDLLVFNKKTQLLEAFEVKRGGKHDSDAKKGIRKRLQAAKLASSQFCTSVGISCKNVETGVITCHGKPVNVAGHKNFTKDDLDAKFGSALSSFVDEVDDYYKFRLRKVVSINFLEALREFGIDPGREAKAALDEAMENQLRKAHTWDTLK